MTDCSQNIIKHLVLCGGGVYGLTYYGVARESNKKQVWYIDNIKTIYATSIGSVLGIVLALKYDWSVLDDYFIKRPWQTVFKYNIYTAIDSIKNRGMFDKKHFDELVGLLFSAKDISLDITMKDFYDLTGIEIHMITTELNNFSHVDISYKTHPDWKLLDAAYCSSCLPILFAPLCIDSNYYCDGGFFINYPITECIKNGADPKEILGIRPSFDNNNPYLVKPDSNIFEYAFVIIMKILDKISLDKDMPEIGVEYTIPCNSFTIYSLIEAMTTMETRIKFIDIGANLILKKDGENDSNIIELIV